MSTFTDKLVNRIAADEQISSLFDYNDTVSEAEKAITAEKVGRATGDSGANGTDGGSLSEFVDATFNTFDDADAQRWIRISGSSNGNDGFYHIDVVNSTSSVNITPALAATETGLTWEMYETPSLESDIHLILTQTRDIIDDSQDWFQNMPRQLDPANTDAGNTKNDKVSLKYLSDKSYGNFTKILRNLTFTGQAIVDTDTGKLVATTKAYATAADRTGGSAGALPVFNSVANAGSYYDEGAVNGITKVAVIDEATGDEMFDGSGNVIFAKLHDGADNAGTGDGTDVFVRFYVDDGSNGGLGAAYTWAIGAKTVRFEMPCRKRKVDILEYEEDIRFIGATLGDAETAQDISEIRDALGIADGDGSGNWDLTNTTNFYPFSELTLGTATLEDIVNKLNEEIGSRDYTAENFVTDGQTITESIDALDQALAAVDASSIKSKILERITADIARGTAHTIPFATGSDVAITSYLQDTGHRGLNMDVYVGGVKLIPDSSASAMDGEYEETSTTQVTFRFRVKAGQAIEYVIREEAP